LPRCSIKSCLIESVAILGSFNSPVSHRLTVFLFTSSFMARAVWVKPRLSRRFRNSARVNCDQAIDRTTGGQARRLCDDLAQGQTNPFQEAPTGSQPDLEASVRRLCKWLLPDAADKHWRQLAYILSTITCNFERLCWVLAGPAIERPRDAITRMRDWGPGDTYGRALLAQRSTLAAELRAALEARDRKLDAIRSAVARLRELPDECVIPSWPFRPDTNVASALSMIEAGVQQLRNDPLSAHGPRGKRLTLASVLTSPRASRPRGRPRKTWRATAEDDLKRAGLGRAERALFLYVVERRAKLMSGFDAGDLRPLSRYYRRLRQQGDDE
jgi:hypothetical protein